MGYGDAYPPATPIDILQHPIFLPSCSVYTRGTLYIKIPTLDIALNYLHVFTAYAAKEIEKSIAFSGYLMGRRPNLPSLNSTRTLKGVFRKFNTSFYFFNILCYFC